MIISLIKILIIMLIIMIIYTCVFEVLFWELEPFDSYWKNFYYLFNTLMAIYEFRDFNDSKLTITNLYVAHILLASFILIMLLIFRNVLVGLITSIFIQMKESSLSLYLWEVILLSFKTGSHNYYSAIVSAPAPLNVAVYPLIPVLMCFKSPTLNSVILIIIYLPLGFIAFCLYTVIAICLIPLAYLCGCYWLFTKLKSCRG